MTWWIIGAALLAAAALGLWMAFRSPRFVAGLSAIAASAAWQAVKPRLLKRMPAEQEAERNKAYRRGDDEWLRKRNGSLK